MFLNLDKKFLWIWIPKAAGSFIYNHPDIQRYYPTSAGNHAKFSEMEDLFLDIEEKGNFKHRYLPECIWGFKDPIDIFKFAFSRNPYDRLVSAYFSFSAAHNFSFDSFEDFLLNNFKDEHGNYDMSHSQTSRSTYRRYSHFTEKHYCNDHFDTQSSFIKGKSQKISFDFVGRYENLKNDFDFVCEKLRMPFVENKVFNKTDRKSHDNYKFYYEGPRSEEKIKIANMLYKEDFINFNYKPW